MATNHLLSHSDLHTWIGDKIAKYGPEHVVGKPRACYNCPIRHYIAERLRRAGIKFSRLSVVTTAWTIEGK
jgi:hypothetical protein